MANETKQLTVSDLETAKAMFENRVESAMADIFHRGKTGESRFGQDTASYAIAATCIGIVEEMVKCVKPQRGECSTYRRSEMCENTTFDLQDETGWAVGEKFFDWEDAEHLASLHNLWLKAVAAFGGEVK